jgi:hypothetical protein
LALIGLLVVFIVGSVFYRFAANKSVKQNKVPLNLPRFIVAGIGMYVIALSTIYLYQNLTLGSMTGLSKGLTLGLILGVVVWGLPFFADADYLKGDGASKWTVLFNWIVAYAALGAIIGLILK